MGFIQGIKNLFGGDSQVAQSSKQIVLDTYSSVENLISKKEMKTLAYLYVSGPARAGKGSEILSFVRNFSKKHNALKTLDLSGVIGLDEIPENALSGCSSLTKVVLPKGLLSIKNEAFKGCSNLEKVVLPEGLERIHEAVFANCVKLNDIDLPKSLYRLGKEVFAGDDALVKMIIPSKVESIGTGCFNCKNLKEIIVEPHNPSYISVDNVLYSRNGSALVKYASGKENSSFEVPENVAKIVEEAFYSCDNIKSITFNNGLNIIGDAAFKNCKTIESINILANVSCIGDEAFANCSNLANVKFEYGITKIGSKAFYGCPKINSMKLPNSLVKIGDEAFANNPNLKLCDIPSSVEYLGKNIFQGTQID